jgi:glutamate/tyrosine decarboxylase-like PLP-dependent enzyme
MGGRSVSATENLQALWTLNGTTEAVLNPILSSDLARLTDILEQTCREAQKFLKDVANRPVALAGGVSRAIGLRDPAIGFEGALNEFRERYAPGFSASAGPRYWGFVTGGATPASLAADWLVSTYDQNPTSALDSSAPDLERETIALLRELFGISDAHTGSFVTGATMSNVVGLALGREWIGEEHGIRISEQGLSGMPPVKIVSGTPHSSVYKALSILGMGRFNLELVPTLPDREAVDLSALETSLRQKKDQPCIVVANAGTVNTVDFDDLLAIARLKTRYRFWLHVDGAFGAFAALSNRYAHLVSGLDQADSICIDAHKWLNVPYDSAVQFTRHQQLQLRIFQNTASYLGSPGEKPDFVHLTPENSRRLRALPAWFSLKAYGRDGHREIIERNCAMAALLGDKIAGSQLFSLLAPVRMNVVCFTLNGGLGEKDIRLFIEKLRDGGVVFLTSTNYKGRWAVRAALSNWRTREEDVHLAWTDIQRAGAETLGSSPT